MGSSQIYNTKIQFNQKYHPFYVTTFIHELARRAHLDDQWCSEVVTVLAELFGCIVHLFDL